MLMSYAFYFLLLSFCQEAPPNPSKHKCYPWMKALFVATQCRRNKEEVMMSYLAQVASLCWETAYTVYSHPLGLSLTDSVHRVGLHHTKPKGTFACTTLMCADVPVSAALSPLGLCTPSKSLRMKFPWRIISIWIQTVAWEQKKSNQKTAKPQDYFFVCSALNSSKTLGLCGVKNLALCWPILRSWTVSNMFLG